MKPLFVDTSGWMMLADAADPHHAQAVAARDAWLKKGGALLSTDYVVDETLTLLRMRLGLPVARRWWEMVDASPRAAFETIDPTRADKAREWFFRWNDKAFSFTDCSSFVVMQQHRLKFALTADRHFEQAGFTMVP